MLEKHFIYHEEKQKMFKCDKCELCFYANWRLRKLREVHDNRNKLYCHYFNNKKFCPFEKVGCKFAHKVSNWCFYQENC